MTAWKAIRDEMTKRSRPGSAGYHADLIRAVDVFLAVLPHLEDQAGEQAAFNEDAELTQALLMRGNLEKIGL